MKSFIATNGTKCSVLGNALRVGAETLAIPDVVQLTRLCLTEIPLGVDDTRLKLIDEIRESLVKEEPGTGKRWIILDALRSVTLRKWRRRMRPA